VKRPVRRRGAIELLFPRRRENPVERSKLELRSGLRLCCHHRPRLRRQLRCALAFALLLATVTTRPAGADDIVAVYTTTLLGGPSGSRYSPEA